MFLLILQQFLTPERIQIVIKQHTSKHLFTTHKLLLRLVSDSSINATLVKFQNSFIMTVYLNIIPYRVQSPKTERGGKAKPYLDLRTPSLCWGTASGLGILFVTPYTVVEFWINHKCKRQLGDKTIFQVVNIRFMYMISWGEVQYHSCEWYGSSTKEAIVRDHSYTVCFKDEMNHNKIGGTKTISIRPSRDIQTLTSYQIS